MAQLDFPLNPTVGQVYAAGEGAWSWDGIKWESAYSAQLYLPLTGGVLANPGNLTISGVTTALDCINVAGAITIPSDRGYPTISSAEYASHPNGHFSWNMYLAGAGWKYLSTGFGVVMYADTAGDFSVLTAPSGTVGSVGTTWTGQLILSQAGAFSVTGNITFGGNNTLSDLTFGGAGGGLTRFDKVNNNMAVTGNGAANMNSLVLYANYTTCNGALTAAGNLQTNGVLYFNTAGNGAIQPDGSGGLIIGTGTSGNLSALTVYANQINCFGAGITCGPLTVNGEVSSQGGNAGFSFLGRDTGNQWILYAQGGSARIWYTVGGDRMSIDTSGNISTGGNITASNNVIGNNSVQSNGVYFYNNGGAFYSPQSIYSGSEVRAAGAIWTGGIYWQNNGGMYTPWSVISNGNIQANASLYASGDVHVGSYLYLSTGTLYNPGDGWGYFNGSFRANDFQSNNNVNSSGQLICGGLAWQNYQSWMYTGSGVWCAQINTGPIQLNGNNINGGAIYYSNGTAWGGWGAQYNWTGNGNYVAFQCTDAFYAYNNQGLAGGVYWTYCDERMKWDFRPVTRDCLAAINAIELRSFDFSEGSPRQRRTNLYETRPEHFRYEDLPRIVKHIETGFIAQQLREIIPEAVPEPPEEGALLSVDMRPMVATLIGAVQQLTARLEALESR